jgi:restriction endonuclease Mrr
VKDASGVDVYATKGKDLEQVNWVIQCKCYAPSRKVDRSIVHELVGVLAEYSRATRGMIVTTSDFSADAKRTAEGAGIRLINGAEFAALIVNVSDVSTVD